MIYERYERYEQRMLALSRIVAFIKRHYMTVIVLPVALITLLITFLSVMVAFTGAITCPAATYGETPTANATAFLSDVSYQHTVEGEVGWSEGLPTRAGEYRVRAVSRNGFGKLRYSEEITLVIAPAALRFQYDDFTCVYGESSGVSSAIKPVGLVLGDKVKDLVYEIEGDSTVRVTSFRVVAIDGTDVTSCYRYTPSSGDVTLMPRPITVATESLEKLYDGTPLSGGDVTVVSGSPVEGDSLRITSSASLADVGTVKNEITVRVVNQNGSDISHLYNITYDYGTLNVKKRPITVTSGNAEKVYDGLSLTRNAYDVTKGTLVSGDKLTASFTANALYVGAHDNTFVCTVKNSVGRDVTENYDITYAHGKLTVTPIVLRFKTGSAEKVYDGKPLTNSSWKHVGGSLIAGHSFSNVRTTGSQINVGTSDNTLQIKIIDRQGQDITAKIYAIELDAGKLTVTPRPITITSESASKLYDGRALIAESCSYSGKALVDGHDLSSLNVTGSQTAVGSSPNYFTIKISDSATHRDVTHNYTITYEYGTLTVYPNPNHKEQKDSDYSISKNPFTPDANTVYAEYSTKKSFVMYLREMSYGDYVANGTWKLATPYEGSSGKNPLFFAGTKLMNPPVTTVRLELMSNCPDIVPYYMYYSHAEEIGITGNDVKLNVPSSSYNPYIYTELNMSRINQKNTWVDSAEPAYRKFVYETYLQLPESTKTEILKIAAENGIKANSKTVIEDVANYISHAATYNLNFTPFPDGVDMAIYFLTTAKEGICQHYATSAVVMYRALGIPARYTVGFKSETDPSGKTVQVTGENAHAWVEVYLDGIGWMYVEVTGGSHGGAGGGGGGGYGTPSDLPVITVRSYSVEKYYDGRRFEEYTGEKYWISSGSLQTGHRLEATVTEEKPGYLVPGEYTNALKVKIVDAYGKDVTDQYSVRTYEGKRTILKRPIVIQSASATKVYDGTPLENKEWWIVSGSLVPGNRLNVSVWGTQTKKGSSKNKMTVTVQTATGTNISRYYDIQLVLGTLNVTND